MTVHLADQLHTHLVAELVDLCARRAEVYPVRDEIHALLTERLVAYTRWFETHQPPDWQPDRPCLDQARSMRPLLIGGFYKSGTTFVLNLLDGHPEISALPGDAKLLQTVDRIGALPPAEQRAALREWLVHHLINPTGLPPFFLFGQAAEPYHAALAYLDLGYAPGDSPARIIEAIVQAYTCANPAAPSHPRFWVDKTPTQELHADRWLSYFPDATFIHVIRNPLATLAAMKTFAVTRHESFRMVYMIEQMRRSMRCGLDRQRELGESRYAIVRYEDILDQPEKTMRQLAVQIGLAWHESLLAPTINGLPGTPNSAYRENRVSGEIQKRSVDRWKQQLSSRDVYLIVEALYDEAVAYGYDWSSWRPAGFQTVSLRIQRGLTASLLEPASRFLLRLRQAVRRRLSWFSK